MLVQSGVNTGHKELLPGSLQPGPVLREAQNNIKKPFFSSLKKKKKKSLLKSILPPVLHVASLFITTTSKSASLFFSFVSDLQMKKNSCRRPLERNDQHYTKSWPANFEKQSMWYLERKKFRDL